MSIPDILLCVVGLGILLLAIAGIKLLLLADTEAPDAITGDDYPARRHEKA